MIDKQKVTWIPAHPSNGALSMQRYWGFLEKVKVDGRYECDSVIPPSDLNLNPKSKAVKLWFRKFRYPQIIGENNTGSIVHVLDHSWADMLKSVSSNAKKVVTVHDLIPLRYQGELSKSQLRRFKSWVAHLKNADALIAVSEYTKHEIHDLLGIDLNRIFVVPNGVENCESSTISIPFEELVPKKNELRVGSIGSTQMRKNLELLPTAFDKYQDLNGREIKFVRAGRLLSQDTLANLCEVLGTENVVELGVLSDEDIERFYSSIDVLVIPSLYEGFGLPVLEAMARGVPVISANSSSLPEVGGEAALYFDPSEPDHLAVRLMDMNNEQLVEHLKSAGRLRAENYSWEKCLSKIYEVYDQIL